MIKKLCIIFIACISLSLFIIACQKSGSEWPAYVKNAIWIPPSAVVENRTILNKQYSIKYTLRECYPGMEYIDGLVAAMRSKGWNRLELDFQNKTKLSHAKNSGGKWDNFENKSEKNVFIWVEQWKDSGENITMYVCTYVVASGDSIDSSCDLSVNAIYIPKEMLPPLR